jgi:phage shock protein A
MNLLIIIGIVVGLLIIIGASQRKKWATWFKSEVNDISEKITDPIKVLKLGIKEAESSLKTLVDNAAKIFAEERAVEDQIKILKDKIKSTTNQAKEFKESDKNTKAKAKVELLIAYEKELKTLKDQYRTIMANREKVEGLVEKQKTHIAKSKARLTTVEANKSAAEACRSVSTVINDYEVVNLPDVENKVLKELNTESKKLEYIEEDTDDISSKEVEDRLKNL